VGDSDARALLSTLPPDQPVVDQLEYIDSKSKGRLAAGGRSKTLQAFILTAYGPMLPFLRPLRRPRPENREEAEFAKSEAIRKDSEDRLAAEQAASARLQAQLDSLTEADRLALFAEVKADKLAVARRWPTG